jgi:polygalacturonase
MFLDFRKCVIASQFGMLGLVAGSLFARDTRRVEEPTFPDTCITIPASLQTSPNGALVADSDNDAVSAAQTKVIQDAFNRCSSGQAVELAAGSDGNKDAFLIDPLTVPAGVSLLVDGGVTVFGSRNPANYQAEGARALCGVASRSGDGCRPLLSFSSNSGLYGYGVVDGRGYAPMSSGPNVGKPWWDLTMELKDGQNQNIPRLIIANGNNFTAYKITLRNAPFYHLQWTGDGLTVWGMKLESVWNVPNTDGINIWGTNATVRDVVLSEGDDQIAIDAREIPAANITIDQVTGYSRNGLSIGSGIAHGVSNVLIENSNLTGGVVSLKGSAVNGMTLEEMKSRYGITEYQQALPTRATRIRGLNIKTRPEMGGYVRHVTYANICMKDLNIPIEFAPYFGRMVGTNYPAVEDITFKNIHVLAPDEQGLSRYTVNFQAYIPELRNQVAFDNVVFDDLPSGESSIESITAIDNQLTTRSNVYPALLNKLAASDATKTTLGSTALNLKNNIYTATTPESRQSAAYNCPARSFPYLAGDLYISTGATPATGAKNNLQTATLPADAVITLHAVVQPTMSQVTYFAKGAYKVMPGLLAVGAPDLTEPITIYQTDARGKTTVAGKATLAANGTLASLTVSRLKRGTYHFTASYPGDRFYGQYDFGSVSVTVR